MEKIKIRQVKLLSSGVYTQFQFDVGKGSQIKHIIVSSDIEYDNDGDSIRVWATPTPIPTQPGHSQGFDIRDISRVTGAPLAGMTESPSNYKPYELWDKEVFSERESYYVGVVIVTTDASAVQIDLIFTKNRGKK